MTISSDMLRRLGSGVRPGPVANSLTPSATGKTPTESQGFEELLKAAQSASFRSEPVKLGRGSKVELDAGQLRRLGPAVDNAEAGGAGKLLAFIDGRGVVIDVASRTVESVAKPGGGMVNGVDAVVMVPDEPVVPGFGAAQEAGATGKDDKNGSPVLAGASGSPSGGVLPLPSMESIRNSSVANLLASLKGAA
jgi:hypothetical protein